MKILTKHIFPIYDQIYKGITLPNNYVDGIVIQSDKHINIPIGIKCIYSRGITNDKYLKIILPFPIRHNSCIYDKGFKIPKEYLSDIGESLLLYNHDMIYINNNTKASDINIKNILLNTTNNISTTIIIDYDYYTVYFLNKFLKLPYKFKSIISSICGKNPKNYLCRGIKKSYVCITILNLNDCKPSFSNNFKGIGIKIQLYHCSNDKIINSFTLLSCLYSDSYKDLYYIDGNKIFELSLNLKSEIEMGNEFIRVQKKSLNYLNNKKSILNTYYTLDNKKYTKKLTKKPLKEGFISDEYKKITPDEHKIDKKKHNNEVYNLSKKINYKTMYSFSTSNNSNNSSSTGGNINY